MVQGIGHLSPDQEIVGSIPAEGAMARISPVWEAVRKTAVGRFDLGPRLQRSVAQHGERGCPLSSRLRVRVPPDRPNRSKHENLTRVLTLWGSRRGWRSYHMPELSPPTTRVHASFLAAMAEFRAER